MVYIVYILKIVLYFGLVFLLYSNAKHSERKGKKLPLFSIVFFSFCFGVYSILVGNPELSSDRESYFIKFDSGERVAGDTVGLGLMFRAIYLLSPSVDLLWFSFEFLYILLTLWVYRVNKASNSRALLLLMLSQYPIFGFYALKQSICNAFSIMALTCYFNNDGPKGDRTIGRPGEMLIVSLCSIIAIVFHEAGYALIPILFILTIWNNESIRRIGYFSIILLIVLFPLFQTLLFGRLMDGSEDMSDQLSAYADNDSALQSVMTVFKGFHFYIITYVGFKYRRALAGRIKSYDKYMLLSCIASMSVLISGYMYWYFRFSMLVSFLVFVFACRMYIQLRAIGKPIKWFSYVTAILFLLSLKDLIQYYFVYGGI